MSELTLLMLVEWDIFTEAECLIRMHPNPQYTYEELEAANWSPDELGF